MEIERKWMVKGWPKLPDESLLYTERQEQGYVHADAPVVRIRLEGRTMAAGHNGAAVSGQACSSADHSAAAADRQTKAGFGENGPADQSAAAADHAENEESVKYVLCFKSAGLLVRKEIELDISKERFEELSDLIGLPLIKKIRKTYLLPDGLKLEVNLVDEGLSTEFMYAEVEFSDEMQARSWNPATFGLGDYLNDDVTEKNGQSMSAYWVQTRQK